MARPRADTATKERMWYALLAAAQSHHHHPAEHGMVTLIANDAGVTKASVSDWKNGVSYPEDRTLRALAVKYGVSAQALSGYDVDGYGAFGTPDALLTRAADHTERVCGVLLPNASVRQFIWVMRRAHDLLLQGKSDNEVRGELFYEISRSVEYENLHDPEDPQLSFPELELTH